MLLLMPSLLPNSSTIVITELSSELEYKERCVSLHFLTSIPGSKMIEVVRGLYTSDEAFEKVYKFVKMLGKISIPVEESPGLDFRTDVRFDGK